MSLGKHLSKHLAEHTAQLGAMLAERIPELVSDPRLAVALDASLESNLETLSLALRHQIDVDHVVAPSGATDYARRLAQHGVPSKALVRAYRLCHQEFVTGGLELLRQSVTDPLVLALASADLVDVLFRYVDSLSEQVLGEYDAERERWLAIRSAERARVLQLLLAGEPVDIDSAGRILGYDLRQRHVGAVVWTETASDRATDLDGLERVVSRLAKAVGAGPGPLWWPEDRVTGWVWFPLGHRARDFDQRVLEQALGQLESDTYVALGHIGIGARGFRSTHLQALRAKTVADVGRRGRLTSYDEPGVRIGAMFAQDLDQSRDFIERTLGPLAADSDQAEHLRETLSEFLDAGGSYLVTSEKLHVHRNTVKYRVEKAYAMRGRAVADDRLDVEMALQACRWLRSAVLT